MDKYGLIGYPLGHSFSIGYFNEKFENEGIDARYINFEIPTIEHLREVLDSTPDLKGLFGGKSTNFILYSTHFYSQLTCHVVIPFEISLENMLKNQQLFVSLQTILYLTDF